MTNIEPAAQTPPADVLAGAWSVDRHLSPLALFDPNRTNICAQFQAALIDVDSSEARAHLVAARRHIQAAMKAPDLATGSTRNPVEFLRSLCGSLDTLIRGWD